MELKMSRYKTKSEQKKKQYN